MPQLCYNAEGVCYAVIIMVINKERISLARYEIIGGKPLEGSVTISGAKNAAVAILPAALLINGVCRIENVPDISDVHILLSILEGMGAIIDRSEANVVVIDATQVRSTPPDPALVRRMRASYYLMGAMLSRFVPNCINLHTHTLFIISFQNADTLYWKGAAY